VSPLLPRLGFRRRSLQGGARLPRSVPAAPLLPRPSPATSPPRRRVPVRAIARGWRSPLRQILHRRRPRSSGLGDLSVPVSRCLFLPAIPGSPEWGWIPLLEARIWFRSRSNSEPPSPCRSERAGCLDPLLDSCSR
jgi:hypothetical protein